MATTTSGDPAPAVHPSVSRRLLSALTVSALLVFAAAAASAASEAASPGTRIPFVVGLTMVHVISEPRGDYESLHTIVSIGKDGYRVRAAAQRPGSDDASDVVAAMRIVAAEDQAGARRIRAWFSEIDPPLFPGTVPGFSAQMLEELTSDGATQMTYLVIDSGFIKNHILRELTGTLHRVGDGPESMQVLVNGQETSLPAIHARGTLSDDQGSAPAEYYVLADSANPLVLRSDGVDGTQQIVRIEFPVAGDMAGSVEQQLARNETVEVHSIYFGFNRADLRPESSRMLETIAGALTRHPDWKLEIAGHTDSIGSDADNLALSEQRAAAVKAALAGQFGIAEGRLATVGHGETEPVDTNDTAKGRSHNRRVELRRL